MERDDYDYLEPEPVELTVRGRDFSIYPLRVRQLAPFVRTVTPLMPYFEEQQWLEAAKAFPERIIDMVEIASEADREWLNEQYYDALVALASAVFMANLDFFVRGALPVAAGTLEDLSGSEKFLEGLRVLAESFGGTRSTDSSGQDIAATS